MDWETYNNTFGIHGMTRRDRIIARDKDYIRSTIIHSPDYKQVVIDNSDVTELVVHTTQTETVKNWNAMPGDVIHLGDIVLLKGIHWLVTKIDYDDDVCMFGEMEQCNRCLPFQNKHTHEIVKKWCVITKPYSSNIHTDYEIATSSREYKIKVKYDDDTKLIDVDDRFLLETIDGEPKSYHVTGVDQQTNIFEDIEGGFLIWNVTQDDGYTPDRDNAELMIADYVPPPKDQNDTLESNGKITYTGNPTVRVGSTKKLAAEFYNSDGSVVDVDTCTWEFYGDEPMPVNTTQLDYNGMNAVLHVPDDSKLAGHQITVTCRANDNLVAAITLKVVIGF